MTIDEEKEKLLKKVFLLKERIKELEKDLIHDDLTGLKTRAFLEEELDENLTEIFVKQKKNNRKKGFLRTKLSLLFIDMDNFKKINDIYGHDVGDKVLKTVAYILKKNVRGTDVASRYGGEEFVVSFLGVNEKDSYFKAEKIRKAINETFFVDYPGLVISASIGVAAARNFSRNDLIKCADLAMYQAKSLGRNRVCKYSDVEKHLKKNKVRVLMKEI